MSSPPISSPGDHRPAERDRPSPQRHSPPLWHPAREWLEEDEDEDEEEDDVDFEPESELSDDREDLDDGTPLYGDPDTFGIYLGMGISCGFVAGRGCIADG